MYQTRKWELTDKEYDNLTEEEKRFYQRSLTRKGNYSLNQTAKNCGVKNFDKFHNAGYRGLYNGETVDDISKRKKLRYREDILNGGTMPEELPTPKRSLKDLERDKKQLKSKRLYILDSSLVYNTTF